MLVVGGGVGVARLWCLVVSVMGFCGGGAAAASCGCGCALGAGGDGTGGCCGG